MLLLIVRCLITKYSLKYTFCDKNTVTLYIPMIGYLYLVRFFKQFKYVAVDMYAIVADALIRDISGMFEHVDKKLSKIIKAAIRLKMQ